MRCFTKLKLMCTLNHVLCKNIEDGYPSFFLFVTCGVSLTDAQVRSRQPLNNLDDSQVTAS